MNVDRAAALTAQARRNVAVIQARLDKSSERNRARLERQLAHVISQVLCPHTFIHVNFLQYRCNHCKLTTNP